MIVTGCLASDYGEELAEEIPRSTSSSAWRARGRSSPHIAGGESGFKRRG